MPDSSFRPLPDVEVRARSYPDGQWRIRNGRSLRHVVGTVQALLMVGAHRRDATCVITSTEAGM
jgi:hypothetical protein